MNNIFNKKKINYLPSKQITKYFFLLCLIIFFSFIIYNELKNKERINNLIRDISIKFNYQLKFYEITFLSFGQSRVIVFF